LLQGFGGIVASNDTGIWSEGSGALSLVAREGAAAPVTPAGPVFDDLFDTGSMFPVTSLKLSAEGKLVITAPLRSGVGGVNLGNNLGIWSDLSGPLALVARTGDVAPTPDGASFSFFYAPTVDGSGHVAFSGFLKDGTGVTTPTNDGGVWSQAGGTLSLIV